MTPSSILKKYFQRKQKHRSDYSLRAFARDLQVSAAFASRMLAGKQEIPLKRLDQISKLLDLDALARKELKKSLTKEFMKTIGLSQNEFLKESTHSILDFDDRASTEKEMSVLNPWYNLALLEMTTFDDFKPEPVRIARALGIKKEQVEAAFAHLVQTGYVKKVGTVLSKTHKKVRLPTKNSMAVVRAYHKAMMELAVKEMFSNTDKVNFEKRLITSTSIAVNMENIPAAQVRLAEAQLEILDILRQGNCTEVYDLTIALFPLSRFEST